MQHPLYIISIKYLYNTLILMYNTNDLNYFKAEHIIDINKGWILSRYSSDIGSFGQVL